MPSGRMQVGGGLGWGIREIPDLRGLTERYVKGGHTFPESDWRTIERQITEAFSAFHAHSKGSPAPTETETKAILRKLATRAKRLIEDDYALTSTWWESLLKMIEVDPKSGKRPGGLHIQKLLSGMLRDLGGVDLLYRLEEELQREQRLSSEARQAVEILAENNVDAVITKSKWRNPHAELWIRDLVPLWEKATGRTAKRTDGGGKAWKFRSWLDDIAEAITESWRQTAGRAVDGLSIPGIDELDKLVKLDARVQHERK